MKVLRSRFEEPIESKNVLILSNVFSVKGEVKFIGLLTVVRMGVMIAG